MYMSEGQRRRVRCLGDGTPPAPAQITAMPDFSSLPINAQPAIGSQLPLTVGPPEFSLTQWLETPIGTSGLKYGHVVAAAGGLVLLAAIGGGRRRR
jgi:hypothetical protein